MSTIFESLPMRIFLALTVFMIFIAIASYASLNFERMKYLDATEATITVQGVGEAIAVPDIGQFTFGVEAEASTAEAAQEQSGQAINAILAFLAESDIEESDIKTVSYNLYPRYRWEEPVCLPGQFCGGGERVQDGFTVSQSVSVKVRDVDAAATVIAGVGERGATNISSLNFVIDDEEALQAEARAAAIKDAQEQAGELARQLGVNIVRLVGYYEDDGHNHGEVYFDRAMTLEPADESFAGPGLPTGESVTTASVSITYEVR